MRSAFRKWMETSPSDYADWQLDFSGCQEQVVSLEDEVSTEGSVLVAVGANALEGALRWVTADCSRHALCVVDRPDSLPWIMRQPWMDELLSCPRLEFRYWKPEGISYGPIGSRPVWQALLSGKVSWWTSPDHLESMAFVRAHLNAKIETYRAVSPCGGIPLKNIWQLLQVLPRAVGLQTAQSPLSGKGVVIAGGGPSLKKDLPLLKQSRDEILIWAGGGAIPALLEAGIIPDVVGCLHPTDSQWQRLAPLRSSGVPLLCTLRSHAETVQAWEGSLWMGCKGFLGPLEDWIAAMLCLDKNFLEMDVADIVGFLALTALHLGAKAIHFVGRELCYRDRPYASGLLKCDQPQMPIPHSKGLVQTTPCWMLIAEHAHRMIKDRPDIQWTTSSLEGLPIRGCHHMETAEWISRNYWKGASQSIAAITAELQGLGISVEAVESLRENMLRQMENLARGRWGTEPLDSLIIDPAAGCAEELFQFAPHERVLWKEHLVARIRHLWQP